jgi:perosamine synthetase
MSLPINVPLVKVAMPPRDLLMPALEDVLYSGLISEGEHVYRFEDRFANVFGLQNVIATSSGTAALHIALLLADVRPGDEVITTSMTAEPTNTAILQVGARPVFADVEPDTGNLDPDDVASVVSDRTRAIMVVHYAGYPAKLDRLRKIADERGVALIEDCAHALGAKWQQRPVGTWGDFSIFSLQAIKHMTTVDGGVLSMRDASLMPRARRLRWFGLAKGVPRTEVDIAYPGYKYNMHNVAAVIGNAQLSSIESRIASHVFNGRAFDAGLRNIKGISPAYVPPGAEPTYWLYSLLADNSNAVEELMQSIGVAASKLHRPNHLHSVFAPYRRPLPGLDEFYRRLVHLPCGWWLTADDRCRIIDSLSHAEAQL